MPNPERNKMEETRKTKLGRFIRFLIWFVFIGFIMGQTEDRSEVCVKCLQHAYVNKKALYGGCVPYYFKRRESQRHGGLMSSAAFTPGGIPKVSPAQYEEIFDKPCDHAFKKGGAGWSTACVHGDGSYGELGIYRERIKAVEVLYQLYMRVKQKELARRTYAVIDELFPQERNRHKTRQLKNPINSEQRVAFCDLLSVVGDEAEWIRALEYAEKGFTGPAPLIASPELLIDRYNTSPDPHVRRGCVAALACHETPDSWAIIDKALEDGDAAVYASAVSVIKKKRHFPLFGHMLRSAKDNMVREKILDYESLAKGLSDAELDILMQQEDQFVDQLCFSAIAEGTRFGFLEKVVNKLNRHESTGAKKAIAALIRGPVPVDRQEGDLWSRTPTLDSGETNLVQLLTDGVAGKAYAKWKAMGAAKTLGLRGKATDWVAVRDAYDEWARQGKNDLHAEVLARAMYMLDADRTVSYLINQLTSKEHSRMGCALASAAQLGLKVFVKPIEDSQHHDLYTAQGRVGPGHYLYKYALHRCKGIHRWTLMKNQDGKFYIDKEGDTVAVVCGAVLKCAQFEVPLEEQRTRKEKLSEEEYRRWMHKEKLARVIDKMIEPLVDQYAKRLSISASQNEICAATNYFERVSQKETAGIRAQQGEIEKDLRTGVLPEEERQKLESRKLMLENALKIVESVQVAESSGQIDFAKSYVKRQKTYDSLYRQFGGDVIVCQPEGFKEGIETRYYPLDAFLQLVKRAEKEGELVYHDPGFMQDLLEAVFQKHQYEILTTDQAKGVFMRWRTWP